MTAQQLSRATFEPVLAQRTTHAVQFTPASGSAVNWGCDHAFSLTIADSADPVATGDTITYRLDWNLVGFGGSPQASLVASIPANSTFVDASGGIVPSAGVLTWPLGDLRPQAQGSAWFRVTGNSQTTLSTTATITDSGNEVRNASQTTVVTGPPESVFQNGFEGL